MDIVHTVSPDFPLCRGQRLKLFRVSGLDTRAGQFQKRGKFKNHHGFPAAQITFRILRHSPGVDTENRRDIFGYGVIFIRHEFQRKNLSFEDILRNEHRCGK